MYNDIELFKIKDIQKNYNSNIIILNLMEL
jgi:hypothetical protein